MISIIVCSRSTQLFNDLSQNIAVTIGAAYEIIRIDNTNGNYSICMAYNEGAEKALYPFLCFVHEDVLFQTVNWGRNFLDHFSSDESLGLIGIAGTVYKSKMPCAWWQAETGLTEIRRMNILQHSKDIDKPVTHLFINPLNETNSTVVVIDGVFMGTRKKIWCANQFDEKSLNGFHGYDLDISFQIGQLKKIAVVYDILLHHFSPGTRDLIWMLENIKVHQKWRSLLPVKNASYITDASLVYQHGWMRLRKNMTALIKYNCGWGLLLKQYNLLFSMLDNRPRVVSLYKDYIVELMKLANVLYRHKKLYRDQ